VIEASHLTKEFGSIRAIDDVSFAIPRGEIAGFLGPNGAGKTTTMRILAGIFPPTSGRASIAGFDTRTHGLEARRRLGYFPENAPYYPDLSVSVYLRTVGKLKGIESSRRGREIDAVLEACGLRQVATRLVGKLSKGYRQRVGLAQALLGNPDLVFLDEPTSGLDPLGRVLVREIIEELRANGTTVFLNSHLLGEVEATCDRVAFVKRGRVVHELVLAEMQSGLDVEIRVADPDAALVEGLSEFGSDAGLDGDLVRLRVAHERSMPAIARWLAGRGTDLYELKCRRKTLEEWFIDVMGEDQGPG